jgi:hypothetical protein
MKKWKFVRKEHEDYGEDGWLLVGAPSTYQPLQGMGVAHDILEHFPNDSGSVEDELLALGAALYVRGEGGYWENWTRSMVSAGHHVASDVFNELGMRYEGIENGIKSPGKTKLLERHVEEWIMQVTQYVRKEGRDYKYFNIWGLKDYQEKVPGWLRRGYRKAQKRYEKKTSPSDLSYIFHLIEQGADRLLKDDMSRYCHLVVQVQLGRSNALVYLEEDEMGMW